MKSLIAAFSCIVFVSCKNEISFDEKLSSYIYDTLNSKFIKNKEQYFITLNPNTRCWACYQGVIRSMLKSNLQNDVTIITSFDIERFINDSNTSILVDDYLRIFNINPNEELNSQFLIFYNKNLVFQKAITNSNTDSLYFYHRNR